MNATAQPKAGNSRVDWVDWVEVCNFLDMAYIYFEVNTSLFKTVLKTIILNMNKSFKKTINFETLYCNWEQKYSQFWYRWS